MRLKPRSLLFATILSCAILRSVSSVPLPNVETEADTPPAQQYSSPSSPDYVPPAQDYAAPPELVPPSAPAPGYTDPLAIQPPSDPELVPVYTAPSAPAPYPRASTSDTSYQDSVPVTYVAPSPPVDPIVTSYQAPGDVVQDNQPQQTYPAPSTPKDSYSNVPSPVEKVDLEERAASHTIHSSYHKELPYEYAQPSQPVEVETFDPYNFAYDNVDEEAAAAPSPPSYTSTEQGYDNPPVVETPSYPEQPEEVDPQNPYPEEDDYVNPLPELPYKETPYQETPDEETPDEETPEQETPEQETPYQEELTDVEIVDPYDKPTPEVPYQEETPYQEVPSKETVYQEEETPYEEVPVPDQDTPYEEETPYQEEATDFVDTYPTPTEALYQKIPYQEKPLLSDPYAYSPVPLEEEDIYPSTTPSPNYYPEEDVQGSASSPEVYGVPPPQPSTYDPSNPSSYLSEEDNNYASVQYFPPTTTTEEPPISSFLRAFDEILLASDDYRTSLTPILVRLVEDASGRKGVIICKLERTRIVLTKAVKALLESYSHWVKLGTTIEEDHCRHDSKLALLAFSTEMEKVSHDIAGIEDKDTDESMDVPHAALKRLERIIARTLVLFGPGGQDVNEGDEYAIVNLGHGHGHVSQPIVPY